MEDLKILGNRNEMTRFYKNVNEQRKFSSCLPKTEEQPCSEGISAQLLKAEAELSFENSNYCLTKFYTTESQKVFKLFK